MNDAQRIHLSVREAAARAGVSEGLVYSWIGTGMLSCYRLGAKGKRGKIVIAVADLDAFLARCRVEAEKPKPLSPPRSRQEFRHLHV
jgi:excisionase family DNA binding protein